MGKALLMSENTLQDATNDLQKVKDLDVPEGSGNEIIELKKRVDAEWDDIQDRVRFLEGEKKLVQAAVDRKDYSDKVLPYIRSLVIQIRDQLFYLNKGYDKLVAAIDRENKKKKKAKKKTGEKGEHHATQAKARAKQILRDAGVMIENDDGTVEYKIDQTNISAWEKVIEDISALDKKQAFSLLYQAVLKGMYKDTRTPNISLKDLKSGKVLKPGGFEKYIGDYLTKPNKRGLRQVDQYKAATIATLIIDDLKKGINLFNEYKPRGRGTSGRGKASGKASGKAKTKKSEPAVPDISKLIEDEIGSSSSSDESGDEEPQTPVTAPPSAPEVVVRSVSPTPGSDIMDFLDPGVRGVVDSLEPKKPSEQIEVVPTLVKYLKNTGKKKWTKFIWDDEKKGKRGTFMKWKSLARGKRATLFRDYAPVANTLEELKDLYATHMRGQGGADVNLDWEDMVDRYAAAFLKDPAKMKEDVKKYAKRYFGYDVSDSDYRNIRIADRKGMAFLYSMPESIKIAKEEIQKDADLFGLNLKPAMKLRF